MLTGNTSENGADSYNGTAGPAGPAGPEGPAGPRGSIWFISGSVPNPNTGVNGDWAFAPNGDVWDKVNDRWIYYTNLMGPAGATGPQGIPGPTGATGATGATGPTGPAGAAGGSYLETMPLASITSSLQLDNENSGAANGTLVMSSSAFTLRSIGCLVKQLGSGSATAKMALYDSGANLLAVTKAFGSIATGINFCDIEKDASGNAITSWPINARTGYYLAIFHPNTANAMSFGGRDNGSSLNAPNLGAGKDNQGTTIPASLPNESTKRFWLMGAQ